MLGMSISGAFAQRGHDFTEHVSAHLASGRPYPGKAWCRRPPGTADVTDLHRPPPACGCLRPVCVKRQQELTPWRHEELTPRVCLFSVLDGRAEQQQRVSVGDPAPGGELTQLCLVEGGLRLVVEPRQPPHKGGAPVVALGPDAPLCLLVGGDAFNGFLEWHRPRDILTLAHIAVMRRPGSPQRPDNA